MTQRDEAAPSGRPRNVVDGGATAGVQRPVDAPLLSWSAGELLRAGRTHRLLSGSLHYFRVHPDQWADRIARLAALGLNTIDTYVAWNFHERRRGQVSFKGWRDVERFLHLVGEAGMDAVVRPGPYICAEWDNGGLPAWLTGIPGMRPRSSDSAYLAAVSAWFDELIPRIARLQAVHGGPVVAVQVENEFGSYGDDADYLPALRQMLGERGIRELLFTADGPTDLALDSGSLPGVLAAGTFGSRAAEAAALLRARRPDDPVFCAELWNGWFDHWGEEHHVRSARNAAATVEELIAARASVNLYMAHGGTNFGLWSGANHDGMRMQPTQTSYDSDAPVAEDGTLTEKFYLFREIFARERRGELPPIPAAVGRVPPQSLAIQAHVELAAVLRSGTESMRGAQPPTFEQLGIDAGLVVYRATPLLPARATLLTIKGLRDRAIVFVDGERIAVVDAGAAEIGVELAGKGRRIVLELVVENVGRINFGPLLGEGKGILGGVWVDWRLVQGWEARPIRIDEWDERTLNAMIAQNERPADASIGCGLASVDLVLSEPADAFLALPGFTKGFIWVGDFLLGRYWEVGPQETYYVPAPLLRRGRNQITVLELERLGREIEVRAEPALGPVQEYSEETA